MNFVGKTNLFGGTLASQDPEIFNSLEKEFSRQQNEVELIASENIASPAVMEAQGSVMTNKYAEGYPGRRYYGCLLYTSPSPRDVHLSRMPSSA